MSTNLIISALVIIIAILVGVLIITNYNWFSQEWLIGLGIVMASVAGAGILAYSKIRR
ncbi:MAG: hypothetical protein OER78_00505 [Nitrosopumilus sp.]|nr:hypothetical protein [Nitrosopumilus sp.]MDH3854627.1 hypothetical protein [Nitrosopumilus sp.]